MGGLTATFQDVRFHPRYKLQISVSHTSLTPSPATGSRVGSLARWKTAPMKKGQVFIVSLWSIDRLIVLSHHLPFSHKAVARSSAFYIVFWPLSVRQSRPTDRCRFPDTATIPSGYGVFRARYPYRLDLRQLVAAAMDRAGYQSGHTFQNSATANDSPPIPTSFYNRINFLSHFLTPQDIVELSHQFQNCPDPELYSLAANCHRRCMTRRHFQYCGFD